MADEQAPPVVAVVVAADSGPWLEECLGALAAQDYPALAVLVVDAGSYEPLAPRVAAVAPSFFIHRLEENAGFGPSANAASGLVEGVSHFLFCHDDVVLEPDALRSLVEEAFRSNAGIVAPKLVDYLEPDRILQIGLGVDRFGAPVRRVERGEYDQSQHDESREVFAAPGGCTLVRADLFSAIGGFDAEISMFGEDVDLCWRARIAGARVVTAPFAVVRHLEATSARHRPLPQARALQWRHELRTVLKNYERARRARIVFELAVLSVAEVAYFVLMGRRARARQVRDAWRWNAAHRASLREARARVAATRLVSDRAVARLFSRRTIRVWRFLRPLLEETVLYWSRRSRFAEEGPRRHARGHRERRPRQLTVVAVIAMIVVLFGSRAFVFGGFPLIGRFLPLPSPFHLLAQFLGGFQNAGMQRPGPAPPAFALIGLAGIVFLGGMGLLIKVALVGAVALGVLGVARFLRPFGSQTARLVGAIVYLFLPLAWDDVARGDLEGLVLYAAMPYVLARLARATGLVRSAREALVSSTRREEMLGLGVLLALVAALAPIVIVVVVVAAVALLIGSFVAGESRSGLRAAEVAGGGCLVAVVVLFPWSITYLQKGATLAILTGAVSSVSHAFTLAQLLRLDVGPIGNSLFDWAFLVGAVFVLFIAHAERLDWAVRLWFVGLGTAAFAWAAGEGWIGAGGGSTRDLITPLGTCMAVLVGLGVAALEEDLARRHFGWRHLAALAFGLVTIAGVLPVLGASVGGRWSVPDNGYDAVLSFVSASGNARAGERIAFLGEPGALPLNAWQIAPGLGVGVAEGLPTLEAMYSTPDPGAANTVLSAIRQAESGQTVRLGARLAPLGIRYIVVPTTLAPELAGGETSPGAAPSQLLLDGFSAQADLHELPAEGGTLVFENAAWQPGVTVPGAVASSGGTPAVLRVLGVCLELAMVVALGIYYLERRRRRNARSRRHGAEVAVATPETAEVEAGPSLIGAT